MGDELKVFILENGSGQPLVCQHTAGCHNHQWRDLLEDEEIRSALAVFIVDRLYDSEAVQERLEWPPRGHYVYKALLGQALGVSRQAVNALETEKHDPSLDLAYRIAVLFARPVEEIFDNPHA